MKQMMRFKTIMVCLSAFTVLFTEVLSQPGFTSIDCGLPLDKTNYKDEITGITYTSDQNVYIDRGLSSEIDPAMAGTVYQRQRLLTVRYFPPGNGNMSCYDLSSLRPANKRYLIRAVFFYGNYDHRNQTPTFDLYLGVELWDTVTFDRSLLVRKEIIHTCTSDRLYVCLVDSGTGTPFISSLELRLLNQSAYGTERSSQSLALVSRWNFAPADSKDYIRYPKDEYDRVWEPFNTTEDWLPLTTTLSISGNDAYHPPEAAMQSAVTPQNSSLPLHFIFEPLVEDRDSHYYAYFYFAELEKLDSQYRGFYINLSDHRLVTEPVVPRYLVVDTIPTTTIGITKGNFSLEKDGNSSLPPIINALEAYVVKEYSQSQTNETDVVAILNIKSAYGVKRDWQGDPCLPKAFMWDGLDCITSDDPSVPPRIRSLDLSSSALHGPVLPYFSSLAFLENLDLSDNDLNGSLPDFLADLPSLKYLNISGNKFSGSIPQKILDKVNRGALQLRADGCEGDKCKSSNKWNKLRVILIVAVLLIACIVILAPVLFWWLRRKKPKVEKLGSISNRKLSLEQKKFEITEADIRKMTNNFHGVIGEGGNAKVYHGLTADGKEVAVKLLSQSPDMEIQFQTEVNLLTRAHHRKLTNLVGYCYKGSCMALVYEYMPGGNLQERLIGNDRNTLSWLVRLRIARDTAEVLNYLHKDCKPPIIHRDVKPANILLNENDEAKLADFGYSREYRREDGSYVDTKVVFSYGYVDPEYYQTSRLHEKSDVYSLGVVILQLITGWPVISENGGIVQLVSNFLSTPGDMESIVDPKLEGKYDVGSIQEALRVAMACTSYYSTERPTMASVLTDLEQCVLTESARVDHVDGGGSSEVATVYRDVNSRAFETEIVADSSNSY